MIVHSVTFRRNSHRISKKLQLLCKCIGFMIFYLIQELLQANLDEPVIIEIFKLIEQGVLEFSDIDDILRKTITRLSARQGVQFFRVLGQMDLSHVARKAPYLCSQIKVFTYVDNFLCKLQPTQKVYYIKSFILYLTFIKS